MKTCTKCLVEKSDDEFGFRQKAQGIRLAYCKECKRSYNKSTYDGDRAKRYNKQKRLQIEQFLFAYLSSHPCQCGESNPILLDFAHIDPATKLFNLSEASRVGVSIKTLEAEIEKCVTQCVSCHRIDTAVQFGWYRNLGDLIKPFLAR